MEVLRQDAQRPRGRALEEIGILMRGMWRVLGLELGMSCGHGFYSPRDANNHCRNRGGARQRLPARVRRIEYTAGTGPFPAEGRNEANHGQMGAAACSSVWGRRRR